MLPAVTVTVVALALALTKGEGSGSRAMETREAADSLASDSNDGRSSSAPVGDGEDNV